MTRVRRRTARTRRDELSPAELRDLLDGPELGGSAFRTRAARAAAWAAHRDELLARARGSAAHYPAALFSIELGRPDLVTRPRGGPLVLTDDNLMRAAMAAGRAWEAARTAVLREHGFPVVERPT